MENDIWKEHMEKDIEELKREQNVMKADIGTLQKNDIVQDHKIENMESMLYEIKGDTRWTRRAITSAIITLIFSAIGYFVLGM